MLVADIVSKAIVVATLSGREVRLLGGLLILTETRNPGAAFSLGGPSETIVFSAIAVGVVVYIIRAARRIYSLAWAVALGLLLGGATGNLTDRIVRSPAPFRGWVVDWIEVPHWPVFNLADSAITCGGVLIVVLALLGYGIGGRARPAAAPHAPGLGAEPGEPEPEGSGTEQPRPEQPEREQPEREQPEREQPEREPSALEQPAPEEPEQEQAAGQQKPVAREPVPGQPASGQPGASEPGPEQPSAEHAGLDEARQAQVRSGRSQPEWPDVDQPRSQWPRSGWSGPEQSKQEDPARDSTG